MGLFFKKLLVRGIASLPFPLVYALSDFMRFWVYFVFGYRKKVVLQNIKRAFPEADLRQLNRIAHDFYVHLCDAILEVIKMYGLRYEDLTSRLTFRPAPFDRYFKENKHVIVGLSHQLNWEMGVWSLSEETGYHVLGFYKPLTDKDFDGILNYIREKYKTRMISVYERLDALRKMEFKYPTMMLFIADQNPSNLANCMWFDFFGEKTPFQTGMERYARETGFPVVFTEINKEGRGKVSNRFHIAFENPRQTKPGEITAAYVKFIEDAIRRSPENYVWSHRRWKHSAKYPEYIENDRMLKHPD